MIFEIIQKSQEELLDFSKGKLKEFGYKNIFATSKYLFALGNIPILLVAHLDTVHRDIPETILYDEEQNMIWSPERNWWRR